MTRNLLGILFAITMICPFCTSCTGPKISVKNSSVVLSKQTTTEDINNEEYLLGPGDVVEIMYHVESVPSGKEYVLTAGDVIKIESYYHPEINREISIRPDGKISLPLKGDIEAARLTPGELREKLIKLYGDTFKDPEFTVTPMVCNQAINQLKEAITTDSRGQSKLALIRPDGYTSFALLGDMKVTGLTLPQLKAKLSAEYKKIIDHLTLSLMLAEVKSNLVYVMGEVKNPGYFLMDSPTTVTQILARAGGTLDSAKTDTILVVSRNKEGGPIGKLADLRDILEEANIGRDIVLKQYDVVYVPKSKIAKADLFVNQYVNQLIPRLFGVNFAYDLHREKP